MTRQRDEFSDYWNRFSHQIAIGKGIGDLSTVKDLKPVHVTTVMRIPNHLATEIANISKEIAAKYPGHYLYPMNELHFTFINVDAFFPNGFSLHDQSVIDDLRSVLKTLPPLEFEMRGLGVFPTTIFAQLYDIHGVLEEYRMAINDTIRATCGLNNVENKGLVKYVAFTNLIRFKSVPDPHIIDLIEQQRDRFYGSFAASELDLVTTDKLFSTKNTKTHATFLLNT